MGEQIMRVDTSLLQGISAANQVASKASTAALKSSTTASTSFSSALKSATEKEKETTRPVAGQSYAEILTGPRAGMYINTGGGARDGEAFVMVKHDGQEDHIYGTGKDRKVVTVGADKSEGTVDPTKPSSSTTTSTTTSTPTATTDKTHSSGAASDKTSAAEKTKQLEGRGYADILNGKRKDLYLNTSGNARDGQAFVMVKRDDREFHIYGTGKNRQIFSVKDPASRAAQTDTATTKTETTAPTSAAAGNPGTTGAAGTTSGTTTTDAASATTGTSKTASSATTAESAT
jgi:hypothetical protein